MPRVAIDYQKTVIYKLVHKDDTENQNIYVGHTTNWIKRKTKHKSACNNPNDKKYNLKQYKYIRENGGWDEWLMLWIEDYACKSVQEALARENYWYKQLKANLNTCVPGRTIAEYNIEWRDNNKEKYKEYAEKYYQNRKKEKITCNHCDAVVRRDCLTRHKQTPKCLNYVPELSLTLDNDDASV